MKWFALCSQKDTLIKIIKYLAMTVHAYNCRIWEAETGGKEVRGYVWIHCYV